MKHLFFYLYIFIAFITPHVALSQGIGNQQQFMEYCTQNYSKAFCTCAADEKFGFYHDAEITRLKTNIENQKNNLQNMLQISISNDPALDEGKVRQFCPIITDYKKDVETYSMTTFNEKKPPRLTTEVKATIEEIRQKHAQRMNVLHDQFGSSPITRRNANNMRVSYCSTLQHLQEAEEHLTKAHNKKLEGRIEAPFNSVIKSAIKDHKGPCRALYKK